MKTTLRTLFIAFVLIAGVQSFCNAQMTVTNQGGCTIYVVTLQADMFTGDRCDWCDPNDAVVTAILPGVSVDFPRKISCGREVWNVVGYGTTPLNLSSSTVNPIYPNFQCGQDVEVATCGFGGSTLAATWAQGGAGPMQVTIQ